MDAAHSQSLQIVKLGFQRSWAPMLENETVKVSHFYSINGNAVGGFPERMGAYGKAALMQLLAVCMMLMKPCKFHGSSSSLVIAAGMCRQPHRAQASHVMAAGCMPAMNLLQAGTSPKAPSQAKIQRCVVTNGHVSATATMQAVMAGTKRFHAHACMQLECKV